MAMVAVLSSGCVKHAPKPKPVGGPGDGLFPKVGVDLKAGSMEGYREGPAHELGYTIKWQSGTGSAEDTQHYALQLNGVSGTLFREGKPMAEYSAESGTASKATGVLTLSGGVKVTSVDENSKLNGTSIACDSVMYQTSDEIVKAAGHVQFSGASFTLGPFTEIWCSNDLSEVATPDTFVPVRHNQRSALKP